MRRKCDVEMWFVIVLDVMRGRTGWCLWELPLNSQTAPPPCGPEPGAWSTGITGGSRCDPGPHTPKKRQAGSPQPYPLLSGACHNVQDAKMTLGWWKACARTNGHLSLFDDVIRRTHDTLRATAVRGPATVQPQPNPPFRFPVPPRRFGVPRLPFSNKPASAGRIKAQDGARGS